MKLKVQQVIDVTNVIAAIIREGRPAPQRGLYWLARAHAKLMPEYVPAVERFDAMITAYDMHVKIVGPEDIDGNLTEINGPEFIVPGDKLEEFGAAWSEIGNQEIEIEIQPISISHLDLGDAIAGSITANELIALGDLVTE